MEFRDFQNFKIIKALQEDIPGVLQLYANEDIDNGDVLTIDDA
jgi:hypothetical protein